MTAESVSQGLDLIEITQNEKSRTAFLAITFGLIADIDILSEPLRFLGDFRYTLGAIAGIWKNKVYPAKLTYLCEDGAMCSAPALRKFSKLSGEFSLVMVANTSHCSSTAHTAPGAKFDDGYMHVVALPKVSRWTLLKLLLNLESGDWVNDTSVVRFKTKELHLEGLDKDTILTVDGEVVPPETMHCRVHQAALRILCSRK